MLKRFSYCFLSLFFFATDIIADESPLCSTPITTPPSTIDSTIPKTTIPKTTIPKTTVPAILHQYMRKANASAAHDDWIVDKRPGLACQGYYRNPVNPSAQRDQKQQASDAFISANSAVMKNNKTLDLTGDVEMYKGSVRMSCDNMRYDSETEKADINGNLVIRDGNYLLKADNGQLNNNLKDAVLYNTRFLMHGRNIRGNAKNLFVTMNDSKEQLSMKKAMMTSCPPDSHGWSLHASTLELDNKKGWGSAYNAVLRVESLPVFYFPYINFPINDKRKTGFLYPRLSISSNNLDLTVPYYFNVAENYDMTYTPRLQTEHGLAQALEARYKNRWSNWQFNGQYIHNDKQIGDEAVKASPPQDRDRWAIGLKEYGQINRNVSSYINYQHVSDKDYFKDWGSQGLDITKTLHIRRDAGINFNNRNWQINTRVVDYQSLEEKPEQDLLYRQLPRIDVNYNSFARPFSITPLFSGQYVYFQHTKGLVEAQRLHLEPGVSYSMQWPAAIATATAIYKQNDFQLTDNSDPNTNYQTQGHQATRVPTFSLDSALFFDRETTYFNQTVSPRVYYYYAQYQNQDNLPSFDTNENTFSWYQLFHGERFSGYDRISDANQLTMAVTSEFTNNKDGRMVADMGIGQILYFKDRQVAMTAKNRELVTITDTMTANEKDFYRARNDERRRQYYNSTSDIASYANWYPNKSQKITTNLLFNPYNSEFDEAAIGYQWRSDNRHIVNLGFRYARNVPIFMRNNSGEQVLLSSDIKDVDFSIIWPMSAQWTGVYHYQYDITRKEMSDTIVGLAYDNCCLNIMLAYQRERLTYDIAEWSNTDFRSGYKDQYMITFTLKGLGSIGSSISRLYYENIPGFSLDH